MVSAVLFDFNGVLVDDEHLHLAAFNQVLGPLGLAMSNRSYAERYLGFDDRGAFRAVLLDHGRDATDALVAKLIGSKALVYGELAASELRVFPDAAQVVNAIADQFAVGIVSGALRGEIDGALKLMGLQERVAFIVAAEDVASGKPDPEGYRTALKRVAGLPGGGILDDVVAVEDSLSGVEAARKAGIAVVGVAHTYERAALAAAGAYPVVDTVAEVTVERLARRRRA